jgi:hypothetical protein
VQVNGVNLLGGSIIVYAEIDASEEDDLEVNTEKTKYTGMLLYRRQNAGQNRNMKKMIDPLKM